MLKRLPHTPKLTCYPSNCLCAIVYAHNGSNTRCICTSVCRKTSQIKMPIKSSLILTHHHSRQIARKRQPDIKAKCTAFQQNNHCCARRHVVPNTIQMQIQSHCGKFHLRQNFLVGMEKRGGGGSRSPGLGQQQRTSHRKGRGLRGAGETFGRPAGVATAVRSPLGTPQPVHDGPVGEQHASKTFDLRTPAPAQKEH